MDTVVQEKAHYVPLVVDLDGTLLKTDLLYESMVLFVKKNLFNIFVLIWWLFQGKADLKCKLTAAISLDNHPLPFNAELMAYLKNEYQHGRKLVLATGSPATIARVIADKAGIFSDVFGSDKTCNLTGKRKAAFLETIYGAEGFDYAGDSKADIHIFMKARKSILVSASKAVYLRASKARNIKAVFSENKNKTGRYLHAIRIHQWLKNALVFVPLLTSHNWFSLSMWLTCMVGFFAFSFCASGTYILNDLSDLASDRKHPRKCNRPFANGDLSIVNGIVLSSGLIATGLLMAFLIDMRFGIVTAGYCIATLCYSMYLKPIALIDTIVLAMLYTVRVLAGAFLINVTVSFWLLAFSIFVFYCLALLKRVTELQAFEKRGEEKPSGRGYTFQDTMTLRGMGIASGLLAIVVFALYINSSNVSSLYSRPQMLWLICPLLLYWINLLWLKTGRNEMHDDPVVFTIKNRSSQVIFGIVALLLVFAT